VRAFIAADPSCVQSRSGPYGADALNYLGLSKYLRLDPARTPAFVRAATALLDAGANPNTGFWTSGDFPEYESAMYGAAGVAHNPEVTRLLLERGADPNDGEVVYHSPETNDHRVLQLLVETGKLTPESLGVMLIRKIDWHDHEGVRYLLEHGAPPDGAREHGWRALHHALARSNALPVITMLLDHGADPVLTSGGLTAIMRAAAEGRADVLAEFTSRGISIELDGVAALVAACASADAARVRAVVSDDPSLVSELIARGGWLLARFAGNGNLEGVRVLLDLGVSATAPFDEGDGYFGIARGTLPIHIAAKRGRSAIVKLLIERGSPTDSNVVELLKLRGRWW
jgi:ankyrin repeat protein